MGFRTQAQVDKLRLPPGKTEHWEFDEECTGLSVRIQGKARSWVVWYSIAGRRRRMKIGDLAAVFPQGGAIKAGGIANGAHDGNDPMADRAAAKAKAAETFGALVTTYLTRGAKPRQRPRTYAETERYLSALGALQTAGRRITRRDIAGKLEKIRDKHGRALPARRASISAGVLAGPCGAGWSTPTR